MKSEGWKNIVNSKSDLRDESIISLKCKLHECKIGRVKKISRQNYWKFQKRLNRGINYRNITLRKWKKISRQKYCKFQKQLKGRYQLKKMKSKKNFQVKILQIPKYERKQWNFRGWFHSFEEISRWEKNCPTCVIPHVPKLSTRKIKIFQVREFSRKIVRFEYFFFSNFPIFQRFRRIKKFRKEKKMNRKRELDISWKGWKISFSRIGMCKKKEEEEGEKNFET